MVESKLRLIPVSLLIFLPFAVFAADKPSACRVKEIVDCASLPKTDYIRLANGTRFPNLLRKGQPIQEKELTRENIANVRSTFDQVKKMIEAEIRRGRSDGELSQYELSWIQKISTVKFGGWLACRTARPNGVYSPETHSVKICPGIAVMPKANLVRLLAHEISHSIDYCQSQGELYHRLPGERARNVAPQVPGVPKSDSLRLFFADGAEYFNYGPRVARFDTPKVLIENLTSKKIVDVSAYGIPKDNYPLSRVLACVNKEKNLLTPNGKYTPNGAVPGISMGSDGGCAEGETTAGEDTADIWSARITGQYLAENPFSDSLERAAFFYTSIPSVCAEEASSSSGKSAQGGQNTHSADLFRNESIFLSDPQLQHAVNCKPESNRQQCLSEFSIAVPGSGASAMPVKGTR